MLEHYFGAFTIGFLGSFSYFLSVKFGFTGGKTSKERNLILRPFFEGNFLCKCGNVLLYCFAGGFLASVFQFTSPSFVPIQALIIGVSWPILISSFLSGRQNEPTEEEKGELENIFGEKSTTNEGENQNLIKLQELLNSTREVK